MLILRSSQELASLAWALAKAAAAADAVDLGRRVSSSGSVDANGVGIGCVAATVARGALRMMSREACRRGLSGFKVMVLAFLSYYELW
jgi:hypothetical protein